MTNIDDSNTPGTPGPDLPPGYWFGEIQGRLRERMRDALAEQDLRRGSWRILHLLAEGPATAQELADRLPRGRHGRDASAADGRPSWRGRPDWRGDRPHPGFRGQDPDLHGADPRGGDERAHAHEGQGRDEHGANREYQQRHEDDQRNHEHHHHDQHHDHDHDQHHDHHDHDDHQHHDQHHDYGEGRHHHADHPHHDDHASSEAAFERGFERGFLRGFGVDPRRHLDPRAGFGRPGFGPGGHGFAGRGPNGRGFGGGFGGGFDGRFDGSGFPGGPHDHQGRPFGPHRHGRPRRIEHTLADFTERGWVWFDGDRATLTDEGRAAHDAAEQRVEQVRASLADGIDPADWATAMRTLERMAANLGWERPA